MTECFYCGALIERRCVGDHFPYPKCVGGTETVPCCSSCHDMKDRFLLRDWPATWAFTALGNLVTVLGHDKTSLSPELLFSDFVNIAKDQSQSRQTRVLAAKFASISIRHGAKVKNV